MATETDVIHCWEGNTEILTVEVVFDNVTGVIDRVQATAGPVDCRVVIFREGQQPLTDVIQAGRTVRRNNVPSQYNRFDTVWHFGKA